MFIEATEHRLLKDLASTNASEARKIQTKKKTPVSQHSNGKWTNGPFEDVFPIKKCGNSIAMLVYQTVGNLKDKSPGNESISQDSSQHNNLIQNPRVPHTTMNLSPQQIVPTIWRDIYILHIQNIRYRETEAQQTPVVCRSHGQTHLSSLGGLTKKGLDFGRGFARAPPELWKGRLCSNIRAINDTW